MANITVNTSRNFDASGNLALNNNETITINSGAVLTIDSDNRWSQNAACPLNVTIDASSGGEFFLEGRNVWWVPFDASTGTVPALDSYGTQNVTRGGFPVGEFLGVWIALGVDPSASGGAMPSSGFIKLRSKSADLADNDVLTIGTCTVTLSGAGQRGWLNIVGTESGTITIPRLGKWKARGDWFDLGVTSGSLIQDIQYYVADVCPALWIESSPGSGTYEIWLNAGDRWGSIFIATDDRGRFFRCATAGVITLADTGCGKLPASGCKIRVPNIHISSTTSASSYRTNTVNLTLGTRWETVTSSSGAVDLQCVAGAGLYLNFANPYQLYLSNVAVLHAIKVTNNAMPFSMSSVAVGLHSTLAGTTYAYDYTGSSTVGGTMTDCHGATFSGQFVLRASGFSDLEIDGGRLTTFNRTTTSSGVILADISSVRWRIDGLTVIGDKIKFQSGCSGYEIKNVAYSDWSVGADTTTAAGEAVVVSSSNDGVIDGVSIMSGGTRPRTQLVSVNACDNVKVRNIGTPSAPVDLAGQSAAAVLVSGSTNVKVQRVFVTNTRTAPVLSGNTSDAVLQESIWGDATGDVLQVTPGNSVLKGCFGGGSGFGTSGIPTTITSTFGTHFYDTFISATQGRIGIVFNEPTTTSSAYAEVTGGAVEFNANGAALLKDSGDQLVYTWPHYILGYTGLDNVAPARNGTNTGNLTIEYDLDKGSGFSGTWKTCNATNLSAETGISPSTGFKPKFRFTCSTANASNAINGFYITGTTTSTAQTTNLYPLDVSTLTITGLPVGVEVRCYVGLKDGTATEVGGIETTASDTFSFTHSVGGQSGFIRMIDDDYKIVAFDYTYQTEDAEILIQPDPDPWASSP